MSHAYTWSHAIDNNSGTPGGVTALTTSSRIDNARADRGNANFDVRHRYVMTYLYELPFGKRGPACAGASLAVGTLPVLRASKPYCRSISPNRTTAASARAAPSGPTILAG